MIETENKYLITGGAGFLGKHLVNSLILRGVPATNIFVPRSKEYDLRKREDIEKIFDQFKASIVLHLATTSGGMAYYKEHPGKVFYENALMGLQLMDVARRRGVKRFIIAGSALGYPKNAPIPYAEEDFWEGYPGELEAPYGLAHKMLCVQADTYRKEYGFQADYVILPNLYGPESPLGEGAHVIPTMIKKMYDATNHQIPEISFWGDGNASREFLYVEDAACLFLDLLEKKELPLPLNLGPGEEVTMRELASTIQKALKYKGNVVWDTTKPSGSPRRALDCSLAHRLIKRSQTTSFDKGITKTVAWAKQKINENF